MNPVVAALYDRAMSGVEGAGLSAWRAELLAGLAGRVLEIGAGTGRNLGFYPPAVNELVLIEPDANMRSRLERATRTQDRMAPRRVSVVDAPAERLPFPDDHFDGAVSTLVLCSVGDPARVLAELKRVLRPDGELVVIEHVEAPHGTSTARWQRRLEPAWKRLAGNCHLTRDTAAALEAAGFDPAPLRRAGMAKAPGIVRNTIRGVLRPAS